tara:strand:+ start:722 stop:934 length:213 start_codon:yes stop_codon:yes gene_type:complete
MIKYITKVDNEHILTVNERNVKVEETFNPHRFEFNSVIVSAEYHIEAYKQPFTTVVLAVELAREILKIRS